MSKVVTFGSTINDSSTIPAVAAEAIEDARGKAVKFDENGKIKVCDAANEAVAGLVIYQGLKPVKEGEEVSVQIKDIGLAVAGGEIKVGDYVGTDAQGRLTKATSGFIVGMAVSPASKEDVLFRVQITKSGTVSGS